MSEPKRWIDEGPPVAVERLLRAAEAERPSEQARARTLTAIGVGLGAGGAAATAGAASAGAAAGAKATGLVATGMLVKWGAAGVVLAAGVVAGKVALEPAPGGAAHGMPPAAVTAPAAARPAGESRPLEAARVPASEPAPSVVPAAPALPVANGAVKPRRAVESPRSVEPPPEDAEHLAQEIALVDRARGALARGDTAVALAALDDYEARFSRRKFAPEALYLRMEALLRAGRSDAARGVAEKLAKAYPTSPHAARARQVLGGTIP